MAALWDVFSEFLRSFTPRQVLDVLAHGLLQAALTVLIVYLTFWRKARRLAAGESDDLLVGANYLVPLGDGAEPGTYCLALRTIGPSMSVQAAFENMVLRDQVQKLARRTTPDEPILPTGRKIGFEVVNSLANHVCGTLALSSFPEGRWLMAVTCEDRKMVRKACIRVLLIREEDVPRLQDWAWCERSVRFERAYHAIRLWTIHRIVRAWREEQAASEQSRADGHLVAMPLVNDQAKHRRVWSLMVRLPETTTPVATPCAVDWEDLRKQMAGIGATIGVEDEPPRDGARTDGLLADEATDGDPERRSPAEAG